MQNTSSHVGPQGHEVGVAVIGAGYWGPNLIRNFLACDDTWLWRVCDQDVGRARKVVGRYTSIDVTDSFDQVLDDPRVEAIAIATPASTHYSLAMKAIDAGKHVLIEKPIATSSALAREIVRAGRRAGLTVMCDHTFCYTAAVGRIREEMARGSLGNIQFVDSSRVNLGIVQRDTNVFWDLLPHDLSILDILLPGGLRPTAVSAIGVDPIGAGQICVGYATLMLPGNAIAHIQVSWLSPVKIRNFVIGGSRRHLIWNDTNPAQRISIFESGIDIAHFGVDDQRERMIQYRSGDIVAPALNESEALQGVVREFASSVRTRRPPLTDGESGVRVLDILEAVELSLASGGRQVALGERSGAVR